ncbi:MAG: hypothetical protein LJE65_09205 [Desulfobacteraceae bacterium]|nr:hypothetical protein [Desulfobacteraceae bacterium]
MSKEVRARYVFYEVGFHGDRHLIQVVDSLIEHCSHFIETGTNVGSTLAYVASRYPNVACLSCEPDPEGFQRAERNVAPFPNAAVQPLSSGDFFTKLQQEQPDLFSHRILFWLDAHGHGFRWPLQEEIAFITEKFTSAYLLIDDFKVPGRPEFGFDTYEDQVCDFDHIRESIRPGLHYRLYYPNYTQRTSPHHGLRGWGLIAYGDKDPSPLERLPEHCVRRAAP